MFLAIVNCLAADFNVASQMRLHEEIKHEIVYDAQGLPVGINIFVYGLQVPII